MAPALAQPQKFGSNYYEFIEVEDPFTNANNSWFTARDSAATRQFMGVSGHLAVITSQAENDFVFSLVDGDYTDASGGWLGGKAPEGWLVGPEAGDPFTYENWGGIEPNNEGYAYMLIGGTLGGFGPGEWADDSLFNSGQGFPDPQGDPVIGYFVEYENPRDPNVPGVPAPLPVFGVGAAFVSSRRLRRRIRSSDSAPKG